MIAAETVVMFVVVVCVAEFSCETVTLEDKNGRVYGTGFIHAVKEELWDECF